MKYAVLVGDGMADYPVAELENRTPLEAAKTPNMDAIVRLGLLGKARTIPVHMSPASDVANLSILGYDPQKYYTGRGPLEAASMGIELGDNDVAFRCNLVTVTDGTMSDYSAGHISTEEARVLIESLNQGLSRDDLRFYCGVSYRHLMVIQGVANDLQRTQCYPPHDIVGELITKHWPRGTGSELLMQLTQRSTDLLTDHPANKSRLQKGQSPANMIWLWGQGRRPSLPTYREKFHLTGGVISAVDLIKGLGKLLGLQVINVPGATGYYDTNYKGKAAAAKDLLRDKDFVFVHVEAPDEAGHNGDLNEKIKAIERFDRFIVGEIWHTLHDYKDFRLLVMPDHPTPLSVKTHTREPVPFALAGKGISGSGFSSFTEKEALSSHIIFDNGYKLAEAFLNPSHTF